jgi:catechol 2,3-dioxygenase-like lactoylglutathione lyase family enzyme
MKTRGIHHVGYYTRDFDRTVDFYTRVLGFNIGRADQVPIIEGGRLRHVFLDTGENTMIAFQAPESVEGLEMPPEGELHITHHLAFEVASPDALETLRQDILADGVKVSELVIHDWCQSIYFDDPVNGIRLEACTSTRELNEDDATIQDRFTVHNYQVQENAADRSSYHQNKVVADV